MITRIVFQWAFVLSWAAQLAALGASANNAANGTVITNAALQSAVEKYAFLSPYNPLHPQEIAPPFRIQPYLAIAAALQAMPRDQALAQLHVWATGRQYSAQVRYLCELLFTGKGGKSLRMPMLGEPGFIGNRSEADWPNAPFTFIGNIPFDVVEGSSGGGGSGEQPSLYLAYCEAEGQWSSRPYAPVDQATLQQALDSLLHSKVWKTALRADEIQFLATQIQPGPNTAANEATHDSGVGSGTTPPVAETLLPLSPVFKSWGDYRQDLHLINVRLNQKMIVTADLEIRNLAGHRLIARLPLDVAQGFITTGLNLVQPPRWMEQFSPAQLRIIGQPPPGEYALALSINGVRASNVASVRIDPAFDSAKSPVVQAGVLEPTPLTEECRLILWVVAPSPTVPPAFNAWLTRPEVVVDSGPQTPPASSHGYSGPKIILGSGQLYWRTFPLIDQQLVHTYRIKLGPYETAPLTIHPPENSLNTAWDQETAGNKNGPAAADATIKPLDSEGIALP